MSKMNELSHTLALEQIKELNKRIKELESAMSDAAIALEDGHFDTGEQDFDSQGTKEAHAIIAKALGWGDGK